MNAEEISELSSDILSRSNVIAGAARNHYENLKDSGFEEPVAMQMCIDFHGALCSSIFMPSVEIIEDE